MTDLSEIKVIPPTDEDVGRGEQIAPLLEVIERQASEIERLKGVLINTHGRTDGDGLPCWCLTDMRSGLFVNGHAVYCLEARAALNEKEPDA